jgi:glycosyltransferase involved in cell wall biosynthesis
VSLLKSAALRAVHDLKGRRDARRRRLPHLHRPRQGSLGREPFVYYVCPESNVPIGGIRVIYRHVDELNSLGINAAVIHGSRGFRCSWFENRTNVLAASSVTLTMADTLVVPEFYGPNLNELPAGPRIVIFNQNAYRTFAGPDSALTRAFYANSDRVSAILVVSDDNASYMRYICPDLPIKVIGQHVDTEVFRPSQDLPSRRVAFMPRRRTADCRQVLDILAMRGCFEKWEPVEISGLSERATAEALRTSPIFLSFSEQEGFGLPPAEAMASGCYVVGYTGLAGREYFDPAICTPIEEGNVLAFAMAVEQGMRRYESDPHSLRQLGLSAAASLAARYSRQAFRAALSSFYESLYSSGSRSSA